VLRPRLLRPFRISRLIGLAVICAIAFAYVQPIRAYMEAKEDVARHRAQRFALMRQQTALRHRLDLAETDAFTEREARRIGLVRPGETLFIVEGIQKWKRATANR
jgi:cell division protein FtsB